MRVLIKLREHLLQGGLVEIQARHDLRVSQHPLQLTAHGRGGQPTDLTPEQLFTQRHSSDVSKHPDIEHDVGVEDGNGHGVLRLVVAPNIIAGFSADPAALFVERLTGISNEMLDGAPESAQVMKEVMRFTQGCPLIAHNASFDRSFWQAEMARAGKDGS